MESWIGQFLKWMRTSDKGNAEYAAKNNHGTWYDLQVTDYALFLGDRQLAIDTLSRVKTRRIAVQSRTGRRAAARACQDERL